MDRPTLVLVHGLAILRRADAMFQGVAPALEAKGHVVARALVQGDGSLDELAARLWTELEQVPGPLVLLCHSMGALQARTLLLDERKASKIRAIASLGAPHAGTSLALPMTPFNRAYRSLTRAARTAWMKANADAERRSAEQHGVKCVSAIAKLSGRARNASLLASQALLTPLEGPNDGLVSATSQAWGAHAFEVDLDHLECAALKPSPAAVAAWCRLADAALA